MRARVHPSYGFAHHPLEPSSHLLRVRRRDGDGLFALGRDGERERDVRLEGSLHERVRLVDDEEPEGLGAQGPLLEELSDPPGRADDDVASPGGARRDRARGAAADATRRVEGRVPERPSEGEEEGVRLRGHLARGGEDERLGAADGAVDALEEDRGERRGLARAALGLHDEVRAEAPEGDGEALHGGGDDEAALAEAEDERRGELQVRERQGLVERHVLGASARLARHRAPGGGAPGRRAK